MTAKTLQLDAFIPFRLSFTSNLVSSTIAQSYDALFGIKIAEWRVIAWVAEREGISQQEICELTRMDKVTVSRAAIALTERGLLERKPNAVDRRSHLLALSAEGRKLYAAIAPKALELERRIFAEFSEAELEGFVGTLRRIDAIVIALGE
ncbi:MarR family winged helix-turn-helix transcriptional regulator [Sphingobium boeckii]|uniref:DNA-binding MarR family transcriptional regulator n=1 Tax=Sphingobium boeckii TaxID=1082345 RepID=A0A7W9AJG2_9SPHN|nr:MarR family winged helix-turn-helix transcriptional regulator [Sphingobium boeckii]MBB5686819.1 DNA-binding MarR family transcriptional regulator [Sphingobium boeckii]